MKASALVPLLVDPDAPSWVRTVSVTVDNADYVVTWKLDQNDPYLHRSIGSTRAGAMKQAERDREGMIARIVTERLTA